MNLKHDFKKINEILKNNNILQENHISQLKEQIALLEEKVNLINIEKQNYYEQLHFYKEAINSLPNPVFLKDYTGRFVFFNKLYEKEFGINANDLINKTVLDLNYIPPEDRVQYQSEDLNIINSSSETHYEKEFVFHDNCVHETLYWAKGFLVPETKEKGLIGEIVDISKEKSLSKDLKTSIELLTDANDKILEISKIDTLTQINNRSILMDCFESIVTSCEKNDAPFSIILADVDFFKSVNDTYGHTIGDTVLKNIASIFKSNGRNDDVQIRYGGEEFLLLLPFTPCNKAVILAERICNILRNTPVLPDGKMVTISMGVTQYIKGEHLEELLNRADTAMYTAKKEGRDQVRIL